MTSDIQAGGSGTFKIRPGFYGGISAPWRGARFFNQNRRLIPLALIPVLLNLILYIVIFFIGRHYFSRWMEAWLPKSEAWYWVVLSYLLIVILVILFLVIFVFTFTVVANLLASPFNDELSAQTESIVAGRPGRPFSLRDVFMEITRTVIEELKKIGFYLGAWFCLFIISLVPFIGPPIYAVAWWLLTVIWLGLSFLDYALARHGFKLGQKLAFIRRHFMTVFGYSLVVFFGILIPFLNLVFFPMAVVGGTLLYLSLSETESGIEDRTGPAPASPQE